jgi:hypothetical protein
VTKDYSNPWSMGEHFAGVAYDQMVEDAAAFPKTTEEITWLVNKITPDWMHDIGVLTARQAGSKIAVPKDVVAAIEGGFRHKLNELLSRHMP